MKAENDLQQNGGYEHPPQSDNDSFQGSSIADGDEDSLRLIAEGLESQYNYNAEGTNTAYTVFLIVNAALGAGLLNFPKSYDDAGGIVVAFMVQLILLLFIMVALIGLAYASDRCSSGKASTIQVNIILHPCICCAKSIKLGVDKPKNTNYHNHFIRIQWKV